MFAGMDEEIELGIVQSIGLRSAGQDEDIRGYVSSCCMHHHALRMYSSGCCFYIQSQPTVHKSELRSSLYKGKGYRNSDFFRGLLRTFTRTLSITRTLHSMETWYGSFQKIGVPQNGWFIMENSIKMVDLGGKPPIFGNIHMIDVMNPFQPQNESSIVDAWDADKSDTNRSEWQLISVRANVLVLSCTATSWRNKNGLPLIGHQVKNSGWFVHSMGTWKDLWLIESLWWYLLHGSPNANNTEFDTIYIAWC